MNYLILAGAWVFYLIAHSFLAAAPVKAFFENKLRMSVQLYRFLYSTWSGVGILALFFLMAVMDSILLLPPSQVIQYIGMVLAVWGVIIVAASFRRLSGLAFLGLKREEDIGLVRDGIHGKIRHPIYSGTILIFIGMFLYTPTDIVLVAVIVIFCYLPLGIYFEEQKLIRKHGEAYMEYKKEVPALIPKLF